MRRDLDTFLPWLDIAREAKEGGLAKDVREVDPFTVSLEGIVDACEELRRCLTGDESGPKEAGDTSTTHALAVLDSAANTARAHREELLSLASKALRETSKSPVYAGGFIRTRVRRAKPSVRTPGL